MFLHLSSTKVIQLSIVYPNIQIKLLRYTFVFICILQLSVFSIIREYEVIDIHMFDSPSEITAGCICTTLYSSKTNVICIILCVFAVNALTVKA